MQLLALLRLLSCIYTGLSNSQPIGKQDTASFGRYLEGGCNRTDQQGYRTKPPSALSTMQILVLGAIRGRLISGNNPSSRQLPALPGIMPCLPSE